MLEKKKIKTWPKIWKLFHTLHLWIGVGSSLVLFLVCLSGTVYTFKEEIQQIIEPQRYFVAYEKDSKKQPLADLISLVESSTQGKVKTVIQPDQLDKAYSMTVQGKDEKGRGTNYPVNPYTGEITAQGKAKGDGFFMVMFRLHRWLLLDTNVGRPIVGVATILFVLIIISGWVIWIPKRIIMWKEGLKIRWPHATRLNFDLHRTLGFYASFLIMIMSLTGLYWSFEWYKNGLYTVFNVEKPAARGAGPSAQGSQSPMEADSIQVSIPMLSYEVYMAQADQHLSYPGTYRISIPEKKDSEISMTKVKTGFFASPSGDKVVLDKSTAVIKEVELFRDHPLNKKIMLSVKAIHIGTIFGTFSKIIYFITCLIATSLPVTGVIIWINKLRRSPSISPNIEKRDVML